MMVLDRLENWKFQQAVSASDFGMLSAEDKRVLLALASMFGDSGWFEGYVGGLVEAIVESLAVRMRDAQKRVSR